MTFHEIPTGEQLLDLPAASSLPEDIEVVFQGIRWPDEDLLDSQAAESALRDFDLLDDTIAWIGRVLKPEWMAPELRSRLRAARAIVSRRDAFLDRYSIDGTKIQIVVNRFFLYFVISPAAGLPALDARGVAREFLRVDEPGEITPWTGEPWSVFGIGGFTFGYQPLSVLTDWRHSLDYLTDGRVVKFSIKKIASLPAGSRPHKTGFAPTEESERHWFDQLTAESYKY